MTEPAASVLTPPDEGRTGSAIETRDLHKLYGQREVVRGVNLNVRGGEIVGLLGPNGAGKTTTFYMIVGLVAASKGQVLFDGLDITGLPMYRRARRGMGYLPQEPSVFRKLTVYENILAVVETLPVPRDERHDFVLAMLNELGLTPLAKQKAYTLSGGERRRLEITRALVSRPRFLLMDEPFSGIDPISVRDVQFIVQGLKSKGIGVLITDHNVRETLRIVDRAYLIYEGQVLREGTADFLANDPESRRLYLGEDFQL
jgi:lipopolysaccharide export system ATP-binding protein